MTHSLPRHAELGPPPELPENAMRIVALGGIGEIGRNTIGFSQSKVRGIQKSYVDSVYELRTTGRIKDHDNDL